MYEKGHVGQADLDEVLSIVKQNLNKWVKAYQDYEDYYSQDFPF